MLVRLDSGILLRLTNRNDPMYPIVARAVRRLRRRGYILVFFPQNLAEFWNVSTRPVTARGGLSRSLDVTRRRANALPRRFELLEDLPGTTKRWRRLVYAQDVAGANVHDARLVAAMQMHGVTHLLTLNIKDFQRYTNIVVLEPAQVAANF